MKKLSIAIAIASVATISGCQSTTGQDVIDSFAGNTTAKRAFMLDIVDTSGMYLGEHTASDGSTLYVSVSNLSVGKTEFVCKGFFKDANLFSETSVSAQYHTWGSEMRIAAILPKSDKCDLADNESSRITALVAKESKARYDELNNAVKAKIDSRAVKYAEQESKKTTANYQIGEAAAFSSLAQFCADRLIYISRGEAKKIEKIAIKQAKAQIKKGSWNNSIYKAKFNVGLKQINDLVAVQGVTYEVMSSCSRLKSSASFK